MGGMKVRVSFQSILSGMSSSRENFGGWGWSSWSESEETDSGFSEGLRGEGFCRAGLVPVMQWKIWLQIDRESLDFG